MLLIQTNKNIQVNLKQIPSGTKCVCLDHVAHVLKDKITVIAKPDFSQTRYGLRKLKSNQIPGQPINVAIFNGVGTGYGDLICGTVAIKALYACLRDNNFKPAINLVYEPSREKQYAGIFGGLMIAENGYPGIMTLAEFEEMDLCITTEGLLDDGNFDTTNMIDYFLMRFGIRPVEKINKTPLVKIDCHANMLVEREVEKYRAKDCKKKVVLLNFFASGIRRFPKHTWTDFVNECLKSNMIVIINGAGHKDKMFSDWAKKTKVFERDNVYSAENITANGWEYLVSLVNNVDLVITPDTSLVHVCGALCKPCVAVFYSIDPVLRTVYYPTVIPYCPSQFRSGHYWGKHKIMPGDMPNIDPIKWDKYKPKFISGTISNMKINPINWVGEEDKLWMHPWRRVKASSVIGLANRVIK
jgi:hypothetical protein